MKRLFDFDMAQKRMTWQAFISLMMAFCLSSVAMAQLKPGATAPTFTAPAALAGKTFTFNLVDTLKTGPVVVYFYPKAFTSGCSIEANLFAQATEDFQALTWSLWR
jgi:hypothetical protein